MVHQPFERVDGWIVSSSSPQPLDTLHLSKVRSRSAVGAPRGTRVAEATDMFHRSLPAVLSSVLLSTLVGCAAPSPDDAVAGSEGAISSSGAAKITRAVAQVDPSYGTVNEGAFLNGKGGVKICHALLTGTAEQADVCNHYPTNYVDMSCVDVRDPKTSGLFTQCFDGERIGRAPYDIGDGIYGVFFVNRDDGTDRQSSQVRISQDRFEVGIDGQDYAGYKCNFNTGMPGFGPGENVVTEIADALHVTVEVPYQLSSKVVGCATGFSIEGLTDAEIAAKDAEALQVCSTPSAQLEGREGWIKKDHIPNFDRAQLRYDATPLVTKHQHIIFVFGLNGVNHSYIFSNNDAPRPFCKK